MGIEWKAVCLEAVAESLVNDAFPDRSVEADHFINVLNSCVGSPSCCSQD